MSRNEEAVDKARRELHFRSVFPLSPDRNLIIAALIRESDWRPLSASWWRGKEVSIIGVDISGNFFLRHCDGSVRYWDHSTQTDTVIAPSGHEFCRKLVAAADD